MVHKGSNELLQFLQNLNVYVHDYWVEFIVEYFPYTFVLYGKFHNCGIVSVALSRTPQGDGAILRFLFVLEATERKQYYKKINNNYSTCCCTICGIKQLNYSTFTTN